MFKKILIGVGVLGGTLASANIVSATEVTSLDSAAVGTVVSGMLDSIITLFTGNIGTILTFAVSFMVLAMLLALGRRFFRL